MSRAISYTPRENLLRMKMQKKKLFVVVEGEDDIPIYEIALRSIMIDKNISTEFEIIHGGGKGTINEFIPSYSGDNFKVIFDLDFDYNDKVSDNRVHYLGMYSIENYFYNKLVISFLLANVMKKRVDDVKKWLDLTDWYSEINSQCLLMLKYIYYYQKHHNGDRKKWSNVFVVRSNSCWKIDPTKISTVINNIKRDIAVSDAVVEEYFKRDFPAFDCVSKVFPGKIVFVSFYRYIKLFVELSYKGIFGSNFSNDSALKNSISALLKFNPEFRKSISPIVMFLETHAA